MSTDAYPEPVLWHKSPLPDHATCWGPVRAGAAIDLIRTDFGRGYRFIGILRPNAVTSADAVSQPVSISTGREI